jgi:Protein of unknown function (DUF1236)
MKAIVTAMATAAVLGCSLAMVKAQTGNPPGDAIEHVGPLSPSGEPANAPPQSPSLTAAQKAAIFSSLTLDKSKIKSAENFRVAVGARVPPTIELHPLPEGALAEAPAARPYRYTMVANQVVLVDPASMRVVEVIKP